MYRVIQASAHATGLPDESVHAAIKSPPYFGMRTYHGIQAVAWPSVTYHPMAGMPPITISAWTGGLGAESRIEDYIGHLILVAREEWRILRNDGLSFWNIGDTYAGHWGDQPARDENRSSSADKPGFVMNDRPGFDNLRQSGLKPKDMIMVPHRFAMAMQADGWYVRCVLPWLKRNCLPESTLSRPTTSIEYIFMFAKSERYFYDAEAVRMAVAESSVARLQQDIASQVGSVRANGGAKTNGNIKAQGNIETGRLFRSSDPFFRTWEGIWPDENGDPLAMIVNPKGYGAAHFATYPIELAEALIKCSTSARGVCPKCGAPWARITERARDHGLADKGFVKTEALEDHDGHKRLHRRIRAARDAGESHDNPLGGMITLDWKPSCICGGGDPIPATVLDQFCGSGTTLKAAVALGRDAIGVDVAEPYLDNLVPKRVDNTQYKMQF